MTKKLTPANVALYAVTLLLMGFFDIIANRVGYGIGLVEALPGIFILMAISFVGILLTLIIPVKIPSAIYISIIGILVACPISPVSAFVIESVGKINLLPLATGLMAYLGIAMAKDWAAFKRIGWRGIVVALFVMFGTFVGSALIAHLVLSAQNVI